MTKYQIRVDATLRFDLESITTWSKHSLSMFLPTTISMTISSHLPYSVFLRFFSIIPLIVF